MTTAPGWKQLLQALRVHQWVVYAKNPFAEPMHLLRYLGRYVNRIAITNHRILSIDGGVIAFTYKDNRVKGEAVEKIMRLPAEEFIRRFLTHILPPQFRRVRYYGFLVNSQRKAKLTAFRALLGLANPEQPYIPDIDEFLTKQGNDHSLCPCCGEGKMRCVYNVLSFHDPPACYQEAA